MWDWLLEGVVGFLTGVISAIVPGMHVNNSAPLLDSPVALFASYIAFTFFVVIPPVFLYSINSDVGTLLPPSQRMAMGGRVRDVLELSATSTLLSIMLLSPIALLSSPFGFFHGSGASVVLVIFILAIMICTERRKPEAFFILMLSGALGFVSMRLGISLMPLLAGMFGMPALLSQTLDFELPDRGENNRKTRLLPVFVVSSFLGFLAACLPGVTPGTVSVLLYPFLREDRARVFSIGAIAGANAISCIGNFYATGATRSGALVEVAKIEEIPGVLTAVMVALSTAIVSFILLSLISVLVKKRFRVEKAKPLFIALLVVLSFLFSGIGGVFILIVSTTIGLLALRLRVRRTNCMGAVMLPSLYWAIF